MDAPMRPLHQRLWRPLVLFLLRELKLVFPAYRIPINTCYLKNYPYQTVLCQTDVLFTVCIAFRKSRNICRIRQTLYVKGKRKMQKIEDYDSLTAGSINNIKTTFLSNVGRVI